MRTEVLYSPAIVTAQIHYRDITLFVVDNKLHFTCRDLFMTTRTIGHRVTARSLVRHLACGTQSCRGWCWSSCLNDNMHDRRGHILDEAAADLLAVEDVLKFLVNAVYALPTMPTMFLT